MSQELKILLINPPLTGQLEGGITNAKVPLGIAYIAAVLEEAKFSVKVIDCLADYDVIKEKEDGLFRVGTPEEEIRKQLEEMKPDVVGINCSYSVYEKDSFDVVDLVKSVVPDSLVIFGGFHASVSPQRLFDHGNIDLIVVREAEYTFREIVETYAKTKNKKDLLEIKGTIVPDKNGKAKTNPERDFIWKLDELPMPARHLLRMDRYLNHPLNDVGIPLGPASDMITSRGCPQRCSFCSIFTVWKRLWRTRSAKKVVDEMELLVKDYGVKHIRIQDDNFSLDKKRVMDICDDIKARGLKFSWDTPNGIAIWTLDEEVLTKMAEAGYQRASFGIETGSAKTLKQYIHKPINHEQAKKIIKICNKLGIWTVSTFIIGFPDETIEDLELTYNFAKNSGLDFALFYVAQPYAGTPLYEQFKREGLITEFKKSSSIHSAYKTHYFSGEELQNYQQKFQKDFVKHKVLTMLNPLNSVPWLTHKIKNVNDFKFFMKMAKNILPLQSISFFKKSLSKKSSA